MWKPSTIPVSSAAAHTGCHRSWWYGGMSNGCPVVMNTTLNPRSAARWISATVSSTSSNGTVAAHTKRGDCRWNSMAQSLSTFDALAHELRVTDRERPRGQRRIDHLGPDALVVEVDQAQLRIVGAGRAREHLDEADGLRVLRLLHQLLDLLGRVVGADPGHAPPERLAVDVDGLVAAVVVLHAAGHARREVGGQVPLEQVGRLAEVGVSGVRPDLVVHHALQSSRRSLGSGPLGVPGHGRRPPS